MFMYTEAFKSEKVTLNGRVARGDDVIKTGDIIRYYKHMHEPPITSEPLRILSCSTPDVLAIYKPPGMPVHPVSAYRHNTVERILANEHHLHSLHSLHRLDLPTSGLVLFGRDKKTLLPLYDAFLNHRVAKTYYARVQGRFFDKPVECEVPLGINSQRSQAPIST
eukprot:TRINITY_DN6824_c0_g1_i1.p1 TRINITY_DN6824_c0_g1~~TRINITY_DN6824_c0_g1_i1.p1  ORF type:complete len:165 (-),score=16.08 TRINITY_DN6824_c0_g1_i1:434-928(-)